ncbi:hypothetical protein CWE09_12540 [Aliidiomarina minuta]|uniref:DUF4194 domain-containing protein n=1 Tax=Aliidiomarina minuta TaxID=880057 RepID=A0A432W3R2_9GAMM|nr:hypothetical protein [Aliidiomarina minuta]RUO23971.1 hypothetical protein CWE09_12540 [Aliidiomarina minuta]
MMQHGPLLEKLLTGAFICAISDSENFRRLQDEQLQEQVSDYLKPLNRRLAQSQDGSVFFVAYQELDNHARETLKQQFSQTISALLPLLEWMQLVQEALGKDGALAAGDTIKLQEFALKTEDNQSLRQRLQALANDKFFNSQADAVDAQVKQIFKRLKENGYLRQPHGDRQYYEVTGKIEHLIELVRFIRDEENLPVSEEPEQEELL